MLTRRRAAEAPVEIDEPMMELELVDAIEVTIVGGVCFIDGVAVRTDLSLHFERDLIDIAQLGLLDNEEREVFVAYDLDEDMYYYTFDTPDYLKKKVTLKMVRRCPRPPSRSIRLPFPPSVLSLLHPLLHSLASLLAVLFGARPRRAAAQAQGRLRASVTLQVARDGSPPAKQPGGPRRHPAVR